MLQIGLQFFAHKKGVGSTRTGRDSMAQRLGGEKEAWLSAVERCVPPKFLEMNRKAFELGWQA